jgi:hypothetical protein
MNTAIEPTPGYFRTRLVRGGPLCGVRIWFGLPLEPWTRETMDRAPCWNAEVNGMHAEIDRVWPACMKDRIDEADYRTFVDTCGWAQMHDGFDPMGQPYRKTNWNDSTPPAFDAAAA